jgi:hypothetical protein
MHCILNDSDTQRMWIMRFLAAGCLICGSCSLGSASRFDWGIKLPRFSRGLIMQWILRAYDIVFGCHHGNLSRVFSIEGNTYRVCCQCGSKFPYSWELMCMITKVPYGNSVGTHASETSERRQQCKPLVSRREIDRKDNQWVMMLFNRARDSRHKQEYSKVLLRVLVMTTVYLIYQFLSVGLAAQQSIGPR